MKLVAGRVDDGAAEPEAARAFLDFLGRAEIAEASASWTHWSAVRGETSVEGGAATEGDGTTYAPALDTLAVELEGWIERWGLERSSR